MSTLRHRDLALTLQVLRDHMIFGLLVWVGFVIFVGVVIIGVSIVRDIEISGWDQAATQVPRWYVLFIGSHLGYSMLPLHIAHGQARHTFARQAVLFIVAFAAFGAVLMAVGFVLEAGLYGLAGWPQVITESHVFTTQWQIHLVLMEYWLRFLVWGGAGAFLGAAFYREQGLGGIAILPAIVLVALAEIALTPRDWWPFGDIPLLLDVAPTALPLIVTLVVPVFSFLVISALAWLVIRDVPLKNREA